MSKYSVTVSNAHTTSNLVQAGNLVQQELQVQPAALTRGAFSAQNSTNIANAATQFAGDASYRNSHPNAICPTSQYSTNLGALCSLAFDQNTNGASTCSWNGAYLIPMDDKNIPADGKIRECSETTDPKEVCTPKGTVALLCSPDEIGLNVGGGKYQLNPSYIAVPKSLADQLAGHYGDCYSGDVPVESKSFSYVRTSRAAPAFTGQIGK